MAQKQAQWRTFCCNPFEKPHKTVRRCKLRPVPKKIREEFPEILPGEMICDMCRKQAVAQIERHGIPSVDEPSRWPSGPSDDDEPYVSPQSQIDIANQCLFTVGETPLTKKAKPIVSKSRRPLMRVKSFHS